ncbi:MAG: type IX secretion system membrane protein PorP/SprF [Bacteroidales bacterium]
MKTRKIFLIASLLFFASAGITKAQQMPQYTQYTWNDYMINPAVAGTHNYLQVRAFSRMQWMGINGAPQTHSISVYGPTGDQPMGYGGYIYSDYTGPTSRLVFKGSYAYNIPINSNIRISGGISLGGIQYKVDGTQFNTQAIEEIWGQDPVIDGTVRSTFIPDASAGFYMYSTYFFAGISAHQLIGNKLNKITPEQIGVNRLKQHFYLAGGYNFILNRDFTIQPSLLVREMFPSPPQAEITARAIYQRIAWAGLAYRTNDAFAFMAGYNHENRWYFGISYDVTYSQLRQYSGGSIEVMFGLKFNDIK